MKIANLSINRPVGILMVVLIILLLGAVSFSKLSIDLLPEMNIPVAVVITSYEGVGPEEIEKIVTVPIEGQLATLEGITGISSQSSAGTSAVIAQFTWGTNMDQAMINMREKVDFIKPFLPSDVSQPMIIKMDMNMMPILMLGVEGNYDLDQLKKIVEDKIQPRLERIEGVAQVEVSGGKTREIQIEISPQLLQAYNLSLTTVSQTLMSENNNVSGGYVEQGKKDYLVRVKGEFTSIQDIEKILIPLPTGGSIELKYLAEIKDTYKDVTAYSLLNGQPSISVNIYKQSDANTVQVSDKVNKVIAELHEEISDIKISTAMDQAEFIHQSIDQVKSNGYVGAILAMVVLFVFLSNVRSTLIIGTAIPFSIITTFTLVYFSGLTLNMMTLGGLALGIGMMVDNAIVVLENIYRHRQEGLGRIEAAKKGTAEVGSAVIASTLTTVSVFLPIVFLEGLASQIFRPLALTVTISLLASLLVALTFVPMLSSKLLVVETNGNASQGVTRRLVKRWADFLEKLNEIYSRLIRWALGHRKTVILATTIALIASIALIPFIGMEFIPAQDNGYFTVDIRLPNATVLEETELVVEQVEALVADIPEMESVFVSVGSGGGMLTGGFGAGGNIGNIMCRLVPLDQRDRSIHDIIDELRGQVAMIPGAEITVRADDINMGTQTPISITIKGQDLDTLEDLAEEFAEVIKEVPGTREVETSLGKGNPELTITVNRDKAAQYGISSMQVSQTVRSALQGASASKYRTGGEEIDIRVVLPKEFRQNINDLNRLMITNMQGISVPLEEIATIQYETGPTSISRVDQSRQVSVSSGLYGRDLKSVTDDIKAELAKIPIPSGYEVEFVGADQEMIDAFTDLALALILAIILMYMILAAQFEALLYPFIIMFSIPATLIGVVLGLLVTGRTFNVVTFIGVIMLAGIVVNNAIILVDYINTLRREGMEKYEAIIKAGGTRLRPILMTTLTTVLALIPQTLGIGEGAELSSPMATAVVAGLSFSTLITLIIIPVIYYILDEWGQRITRKFTKVVTGETVPERL